MRVLCEDRSVVLRWRKHLLLILKTTYRIDERVDADLNELDLA